MKNKINRKIDGKRVCLAKGCENKPYREVYLNEQLGTDKKMYWYDLCRKHFGIEKAKGIISWTVIQ